MSDDDREASGEKWVEARSWSHVDLLEFIRPAFWALLAFMLLPRWWDNHELTLAALNGQALYMVGLIFLVIFPSVFLNVAIRAPCRNDLTPSSRTHIMSTTSRPGFMSFDNGTSTCSLPSLVLNNNAYTDEATGSFSLSANLID